MRRYHAFIPCSRFLFWLLGRSCILHVALPVMFGALLFICLFLIWLRSDLLCLCLRLCVLSAWCDVRCLFVSRFLAVRVRVCALCECPTRMFSCSFGHTRARARARTHAHTHTLSPPCPLGVPAAIQVGVALDVWIRCPQPCAGGLPVRGCILRIVFV